MTEHNSNDTIILVSESNSDDHRPEACRVSKSELNAMINLAKPFLESSPVPQTWSIKSGQLPDVEFCQEDGDVDEDEYELWEATCTDVGVRGVNIIFVHSRNGSELFFEYRQE